MLLAPHKKSLLGIVLSFFAFSSYAQDFLGYANSNYAGVSGIDLNPSSIADSRFKFDMTLIGANISAANNYLGLNKAGRKFLLSGNQAPFDKAQYIVERTNADRKSMFVSAQLVLPSFMITLSPKSAIAFTMRARAMGNVDGMEEYLAHQVYSNFRDSSNYKRQFENKNLSMGAMAWMEYGVTYSRILFDNGHHMVKGGLRLKYLQGLWASYAFMSDLGYNFGSDSTVSLNTNANYGHSNSFSLNKDMVKNFQSAAKPAIGADLGVIYEWRPEEEKYFYDMDGETELPMRYKNKYKVKAGFSVLDIGRIKFEQTTVGDFNFNVVNWYFASVKGNPNNSPIQNLDSILKTKGTISEGNQPFKMHLPTSISTQVDYNIYKDFYANFTTFYSFQFANMNAKVHDLTAFSLTPRWDWKWFGVFVPFSVNSYKNFKTGLSLRLGPLIVGTTNLSPLLGLNTIYGADFHFLLKIPIMYRKPKDRDGDHVSDKKDKCIDVPGVWEFMGCPDRDGDHVPDNMDECPDVPGLAKFNGCPDRDGDGIIDKKDSCPDEPGLPELNGCPDRDHDGVIDKYDKCPDDSGAVATNGCPDRDGDGVLDKDDRCPDKPGPKENEGCPLAKLHLLDKQGNIIATATIDKDGKFIFTELPTDDQVLFQLESYDVLVVNEATVWDGKVYRNARRGSDGFFHFEQLTSDANKLGKMDIPDSQIQLKKEEAEKVKKAMESLEFDFGSEKIRPTSLDGLDLVAELLTQNPTWRLKLSGHTDNVSTLEYNMKLSEKRVVEIRNYLVNKKGVDAGRIVLKWYGPTKPIALNDTEEGRQKNRRVEFLIIK